MKRFIIIIFIFLISLIVFIGCQSSNKETSEETIEDIAESLDIFIVGDAVHGYDISEDKETQFFTTFFAIGDFFGTPTEFGETGFMYYDAIETYTKETGINVNLHWYQWPEIMEADLARLSESEMPDVIISTFTSMEDYYLYMDQGMYCDLSPFMEKHEMYTNDQYYSQVLQGGELEHNQYILPILFTVDTIMGSDESLQNFALHIEDIQQHDELLDALIYAQNQVHDGILAFQYNCISPSYLPHMIYSASGEQWVDYETWNVNLDKRRFEKMCMLYEQLLEEQLDKEQIVAGEAIPWEKTKELEIKNAILNEVQLDEFLGDMGCIVAGGGSMQTYLNSAAAQVWYYESRYEDLEESFKLMAIPDENGNSTAHISYFGGVCRSAEDPELAFDFLKYLLDTEVPPFYGISVNKENAQKQFEYLTTTTYRIRPGLKMPLQDGTMADSREDYIINPLSIDTKNQLEEIINNIDTVTLPNWSVYQIIDNQLLSYAKGEVDMTLAYQKAFYGLEEYVIIAQNESKKEDKTEDKKEVMTDDEKLEEERNQKQLKHHARMQVVVKIFMASLVFAICGYVIYKVIKSLKKIIKRNPKERE